MINYKDKKVVKNVAIGKRIRQAREQNKMSREQLAAKIDVTQSAISNYENNISHPKEPILYKLIEALQVDANFLFQDALQQKEKPATDEGDGLTEIKRDLINDLKHLSDEDIQSLQPLIKNLLKSKDQ